MSTELIEQPKAATTDLQAIGLSEQDLPRLFEQFYRADKSRSRASGGSGIGLSLARQFVEIHGGEILARNRETGGLSICIGMTVGVKHSTEG